MLGNGHVERRAVHRLRLRRLPLDRPARPADAAVDPDRLRRPGGRRDSAPSPAAVRYVLVDTSTDLRAAGARERRPPRGRDPLHARARRSRLRPRRGPALQRTCSGRRSRCYGGADDARGRSAACSRTSSTPPPAHGGGVPKLVPFAIGGPFSLGGVEFVPVPLMHGPLPVLGFRIGAFAYLTDCNRDPRRVVAAARRRAHARPRRAPRSAAPDALQRRSRRSTSSTRLRPERAYFTHIAPRPRARGDLRAAARRCGVGL